MSTTESKILPDCIRSRMEQYRTKLLEFDMKEPTIEYSSYWRFYKTATEMTAFIVNIKGNEFSVEVTYGYASTAFTKFVGCENALAKSGISNDDINLREKVTICNEEDESIAKMKIEKMYFAYRNLQKDDLLLLAKEKRKEFIQQIHARLKPLGFKKKANSWTYILEDPYYLMFNAQKSSFSDEYYFNVYIGKNGTNCYGDCYYKRIAPEGMFPMDWQTIKKEDFDSFLDKIALPNLEKIISTPLVELGQIPAYFEECSCDRQKCEICWMMNKK